MNPNVAKWDQALRFFCGGALVAWAVAGGPIWASVGLYFVATAAWKYCAIYAAFGRGSGPDFGL